MILMIIVIHLISPDFDAVRRLATKPATNEVKIPDELLRSERCKYPFTVNQTFDYM